MKAYGTSRRGHVGTIRELIKRTHSWPQKEDLVRSFSNGRTTSVRELHQIEAEALIRYLKDRDDRMNRMRRKVLAMGHQLGWQIAPGKIDMGRIDGWCTERGKFRKPLQQHTIAELPHLITQFEEMFKKEVKKY